MHSPRPQSHRILFWGDSLTEGFPGVAYIHKLQKWHPHWELVNLGRGGDTILSIQKRLENSSETGDIAVFWAGVNDVFADIVPGYALLKTVLRQKPTKNLNSFLSHYSQCLDLLLEQCQHVLTIPPLFLGEHPKNPYNLRLSEMGERIQRITEKKPQCSFLRIHDYLPLKEEEASPFLPTNPLPRVAESLEKNLCDSDYDQAAERRGLQWTYDGVHLNSAGAVTVAQAFSEALTTLVKSPSLRL
ncbi:MAG: SGNH/GDSL hydrolase family protein [Spirochaetales bacterium]|nr:SGNH/GDSL hydrolase family protein [Spirochaetales bacterium]